jgi:hypothetical protein
MNTVNTFRPEYYRKIRLFCELPIDVVARCTGLPPSRLAGIECGRVTPREAERGALERFLRDKLRLVLAEEPAPNWLREGSEVSDG